MVKEHKLDEDAILQLTNGIRIFYAGGSMESYILSDFSSAVALCAELDFKLIPTKDWLLMMWDIPSAFLWWCLW